MNAPERTPREGTNTAAARRIAQVLLGVALIAVAVAAPVRPQSDVEVSFGGGENPCLAQVAGLVETQVLWFDGVPFFERRNFTGETHLYVTEHGAPDPTHHLGPGEIPSLEEEDLANASKNASEGEWFGSEEAPFLVRSGNWYNFTDANGVTWNVTEAYIDVPGHGHQIDHDPAGLEVTAEDRFHAGTDRYYVWIVELGEKRDGQNMGVPSDIGDDGEYNFATRVNTSKFTTGAQWESTNVSHTNDTSTLGPNLCHPDHNHTHRQYDAALWVGHEPDPVKLDCAPLHEVNAEFLAKVDLGTNDPKVHGDARGGSCTGLNDTEAGYP